MFFAESLEVSPKMRIFASISKTIVMLGIKTRRAPVGGDIAKNIRDAVARVATGQLNECEKASVERSKTILSQYHATWVGLDGKEL